MADFLCYLHQHAYAINCDFLAVINIFHLTNYDIYSHLAQNIDYICTC